MVARGVFKTFDPSNYNAYYDAIMQGKPPPDLWDNNAFVAHMWTIYGGIIFVGVWTLWTWEVYRELNKLSKGRSGIALLLSTVLGYPAVVIVLFVQRAML
jgi:hypothetical protein